MIAPDIGRECGEIERPRGFFRDFTSLPSHLTTSDNQLIDDHQA